MANRTSDGMETSEFSSGGHKQHDVQTFLSLFTTSWKEVAEKNVTLERELRERIRELEQSMDAEPTPEVQEKIDSLNQQLDDCVAYYNWVWSLVDFFDSGEVLKVVPFKETNMDNDAGGKHNEK